MIPIARRVARSAVFAVAALLISLATTPLPAQADSTTHANLAIAQGPSSKPAMKPFEQTDWSALLRIGVRSNAPPLAAAPPPVLPQIGWWPAVEWRTVLIAIHLIGLCFGLGGAVMLDFWILRWMRWGYLPRELVRTFEYVSKVVFVGLGLLWVSGVGFLLLYAYASPDKLANPKLLAKLTIVAVLTLNGEFVHRRVLPYVTASANAPLLASATHRDRLFFIWSGTLSAVSWFAAFGLGLLREFNNSVAAVEIIVLWFAAVVTGASLLTAAWRWLAQPTVRKDLFPSDHAQY